MSQKAERKTRSIDGPLIVFRKINANYILLSDESNGCYAITDVLNNQHLSSAVYLDNIADADICPASALRKFLPKNTHLSSAAYIAVRSDPTIGFAPYSAASFLPSAFLRRSKNCLRYAAKACSDGFSLQMQRHLESLLIRQGVTIEEATRHLSNCLLFDHYSFWVYNKFTEAFSCLTSSQRYERNYVYRSENTSLNDILDEKYTYETRNPEKSRSGRIFVVPNMKSLSRVKLSFGPDQSCGVLTFYSRFPEFSLREDNALFTKSFFETKYREHLYDTREQFSAVESYFHETFEPGKFRNSLNGLVNKICDCLHFEACSVFLLSEDQQHLDLVATCDAEVHGTVRDPVSYSLKKTCLTTLVFQENQIKYSYDLANDSRNSRSYNEKTILPSTNWIGIPIALANKPRGVIRVKNKFYYLDESQGQKKLTNFRHVDFVYLKDIASTIENALHTEETFQRTSDRLRDAREANENLKMFNRVFLHEIRTPISTFNMAPERIKRNLGKRLPEEGEFADIIAKLDDIQTMGNRLQFITNMYYFDKIVKARDYESLYVLKDIVFPVLNITRTYVRKQYTLDIIVRQERLHSHRVFGEKKLLNIVFNALLDNAGKYTLESKKPITVSGGFVRDGDFFEIAVTNDGLPIQEEERDSIFEMGARGASAKSQVDGTGIGLYLSKKIMEEHGGDLLLVSPKDPVTFSMVIPANREVMNRNVKRTAH